MAQASQGEKITTELTCWKVEGKAPPLHVRKLLEEVFRKQRVKVKNVALVVGPHTAEAISWIVAMAEGVRVVVLSAASLLQVGGDLPSLRRWLLSEAEGAQEGVVIVLVRPTEWFVTEDPSRKSDFPGLLRQVVARCGWRTTGPDAPAFISVLSAPSKAWDHAFDEMIPLEFDLSQATMGYRQLPCHREALTRVTSCSEVKEWLEDILASKPGKALPYAIALVGPSGSGKSTFLAALKTLPMKVLPMSIPALINAGIGDTHLAVRRHFERAQLLQPSCVTLDDADELFRGQEGSENHGVSDLLAELLHMLDQFCSPILVFIATCTSREAIPAVLACRLHFIQLNERISPVPTWVVPNAQSFQVES